MATNKKGSTGQTIGQAVVKLGIATAGWGAATKVVGAVTGAIERFRAKLFQAGVMTIYVDRLIQSFVRAWKFLNTVIGVGAVSRAAEQFQRISRWTGEGTARLQAFTSVAKETGAQLDDVADLFQTIAERVEDLRAEPGGGVAKDFARYGLGARDFQGMTKPFQLWMVFADKLSSITDDVKRLAMAEKLLGGDLARRFGQLIMQGSQGLRDLMREAMATGEVLTDAELEVAAGFERSKRRLQRVFTALSNQLGMAVIPALDKVFTIITDLGFEFAKFIRGYLDLRTIIAGLLPDFGKVKNWLSAWNTLVQPLGETIFRLWVGFGAVFGLIYGPRAVGVLGFFVKLGAQMLHLAVLLEDVVAAFRGDDSIFGEFLQTSPLLRELTAKLVLSWVVFADAIKVAKAAMQDMFDGPLAVFTLRAAATGVLALATTVNLMARAFASMVNTSEMLVVVWKELFVLITNALGLFYSAGLTAPVALPAMTQAGSRILDRVPDMYRAADPGRQGLTSHYERRAMGGLYGLPQSNMPPINPTFHIYGDPGAAMQGTLGRGGRMQQAILGVL